MSLRWNWINPSYQPSTWWSCMGKHLRAKTYPSIQVSENSLSSLVPKNSPSRRTVQKQSLTSRVYNWLLVNAYIIYIISIYIYNIHRICACMYTYIYIYYIYIHRICACMYIYIFIYVYIYIYLCVWAICMDVKLLAALGPLGNIAVSGQRRRCNVPVKTYGTCFITNLVPPLGAFKSQLGGDI